jgi:hypothetical protein
MTSNTPRVFVGAPTLLIAGIDVGRRAATVTAAMNNSAAVRVTAEDRITGLVALSAAGPVNRQGLTGTITPVTPRWRSAQRRPRDEAGWPT